MLVHGMVVSSRYMTPVVERLGAYYPVYAPDLPGFGKSHKPGRTLSLAELADALVAWMDAMGLGKVVLLGNSFGCQVAVACAARRPERVSRLVLQGPTTDPRARGALGQIWRWLRNAVREPAGMMSIMLRDYWAAGFLRSLRTFREVLRDAIEEKLSRVKVPALVISAEHDPVAPVDWGKKVAGLLPEGRHVTIAEATHTAVFHAATEVMRATRLFVEGEPLPERIGAIERGPNFIAAFDSSTGMLRATALGLRGEDFPGLGLRHPLAPLVRLGNRVPALLRETVYAVAGWTEAVPTSRLGRLDVEEVSRWVARQYPEKRYPAIFVGSSNGALVHLAVAMGVPWLPQTFLIPVRHVRGDVNDMRGQLAWSKEPGRALLEANPELSLSHMHDPNQDQLMSAYMSYFRVKRRTLGPTYEQFLAERLEPGGTIFVVECGKSWPVTRISDQHWFQPGAVGGLTPEEYQHGSARVREFLRARGASRDRWDPAPTDAVRPEAEWGFLEELRDDITRVGQRLGARVRRVIFEDPQELSPLVADLYRDWYASMGRPGTRLLVDSFILMDPWWTLRTGSVPFWTTFPVEPSADVLEAYLRKVEPYEHMHAMLFSHGVESAGLAHLERWRAILGQARGESGFVGVDERAFPRDFAVLVNYNTQIKEKIPSRFPLPAPLSLERLDAFLRRAGDRYAVRWLDEAVGLAERATAA
ncbi:Hypothetical protein CAP_1875 [Chondromyces apiculatus DSM 436]|uniref:Uncharacterized protein n=1 Tax=Chondromyces apiculatus DSM 436 TaxID=1192034 RepID=A0A017TC02_9BACT|nr:Hypothetical protein CAP_1875 [Chondromyces apiculatus DSM 436]